MGAGAMTAAKVNTIKTDAIRKGLTHLGLTEEQYQTFLRRNGGPRRPGGSG